MSEAHTVTAHDFEIWYEANKGRLEALNESHEFTKKSFQKREKEEYGFDWQSITEEANTMDSGRETFIGDKIRERLALHVEELPEEVRIALEGTDLDPSTLRSHSEEGPWPIPANVQVNLALMLQDEEIERWKAYEGIEVNQALTQLIKDLDMISKIENENEIGVMIYRAGLWGGGGLMAASIATSLATAAAISGTTSMVAIINAVVVVGVALIAAIIAAIVLVVGIVFYWLWKDAALIGFFINDSECDMTIQDVYLNHGKVMSVFYDGQGKVPREQTATLPAKIPAVNKDSTQLVHLTSCGFFTANKKKPSPWGSEGALYFNRTLDFDSLANFGWTVPNVVNKNAIGVQLSDGRIDLEDFAKRVYSDQKLDVAVEGPRGNSIQARMDSRKGSAPCAIVALSGSSSA